MELLCLACGPNETLTNYATPSGETLDLTPGVALTIQQNGDNLVAKDVVHLKEGYGSANKNKNFVAIVEDIAADWIQWRQIVMGQAFLHKIKSEVEEVLKRIQGHKGVQGLVVINPDGIPIRSSLDNSSTVQLATLIHQLAAKAKGCVRDLDPQNDLTFLRIRSKKHEIMVAPDKDYMLIVIQNPSV